MNTNFLSLSYSKTIALIAITALVMLGFGFPSWVQPSEAASLTWVSDTISDSDLSVAADHTIVFTSPTGIVNGETVTVTFTDAGWLFGSVDYTDIDVASPAELSVAADCTGSEEIGAAVAGQVLTLTYCLGDGASLAAGATTTIEIGLNATAGVAGDAQITNPGTAASYEIVIGGTQTDAAATRVAIIDDVVVTASVDTTLTFTISGLAVGATVNGSPTTTADTTTATTLPFGTLAAGASKTLAQSLHVTTNAANGFTVTANQNQNLTSSTGADIDRFIDDAGTATPTGWVPPTGTLGVETTYGHMGITSEDSSLAGGDDFASDLWAGDFVNNAREVFYNDGPADGVTANQGSTTVGYQAEIMAYQEAGSDYTATITYVATPIF